MGDVAVMSTEVDALRLAGSLVQLVRALDQALRAGTGDDPLTLADLGVLGSVGRGIDTPTLIARALRLDPARITHVTDKLVSGAYLERTVDPEDRRRWRLRLTERGIVRLHTGRTDTEAAMERFLVGLSAEELTGLKLGLEGVRRELANLSDLGGGR
ncbi:MAG: transcriptional regulator, MarR family [Chloroflexi bacterium]|jgi:DNA-binding MarR family transcriptional regulator|nr:transcriptional regulator, MarR family [Chloroflexota bacterium]